MKSIKPNKFKLTFLLVISICSYAMTQNTNDFEKPKNKITILFIGNSLTYTNDLPKLVKSTAKKQGLSVKVTMVAHPNYALIDHLNDGLVQKEIGTNTYDFVIIQQGPSSQPNGRESLVTEGKKYSDLCKNNNVKLCYLTVWPSLANYHTFDGVIKNHRDAATINNAILLPVGDTWKAYFDSTGNFDYYSSDGFHPSLKGSQVAADIIVEYLLKQL